MMDDLDYRHVDPTVECHILETASGRENPDSFLYWHTQLFDFISPQKNNYLSKSCIIFYSFLPLILEGPRIMNNSDWKSYSTLLHCS